MLKLAQSMLLLWLSLISNNSASAFDNNPAKWPAIKEIYFKGQTIRDNANDLLLLEAPKRAEDAAIVPVSIKSLIPQSSQQHISILYLFIDNNPMPYAASFTFSSQLEQIAISTRVRVDSYTHMRVVAKMNDDSLHMVKTFIKASGGCSAPAGKDRTAALAQLGKIQIRTRQSTIGKTTPVQIIVSHPNNSGLQMDQVTRGYIPANYINHLSVSYNNNDLITMEAGISLSENPSLRFTFTPKQSGIIKVHASDNNQKQFKQQKQL